MKTAIVMLVFVVSFAAMGLLLGNMEKAESMGRAETQAPEQPKRYEASQMSNGPQYTAVWALCSLGAF